MSPLEHNHKFRQNAELQSIFSKIKKAGLKPIISTKDVTGFHGTSRINSEKILNEGINPTISSKKFIDDNDELLGEGRYLWENSHTTGGVPGHVAGFLWAKDQYRKEEPAVIEAKIAFQKLFDLIDPVNVVFLNAFKSALLQHSMSSPLKQELGDVIFWDEWRFAKLLVLSCPQLAELDIDGARWNGFGLPRRKGITQTGVCVKSANCLKKPKLLPSNYILETSE